MARARDGREQVARWVASAVAGDTEAFRHLYDRCVDRVHRTARWMLATADVEDVVQDVFIRAWEKLPSLDEPAAFDAWLHRLAVNVMLRSRQGRRRRGAREEPLERTPGESLANPPAPLRVDLERAVASLPEGAREVFILRDVEGYSHKEIARMLGFSHHTSRSQLHRARALLREYLGPARGESA